MLGVMVGDLLGNAWIIWMALAIVLGAAELALPGVFLVFIAFAAAMTGLTVFALPVLPPLAQLAAFTIWSAASILIGRRWYFDFPVNSSDPMLNDRGARMIGELVTVVEPIAGGEGRVRVGDGVWSATGPDTPEGTRMRVAGVRGSTLVVEPVVALA